MTVPAVLDTIDAAHIAGYQVDGFLVVRQVFSPERFEELAVEADRWLQKRYAEYGKTETYFR
jgi:hypothetical protein